MDDFKNDLDDVVCRAKQNGILMLTVGTSPKEWQKSIEIKNKYKIPAALGFSPHDAKHLTEETFSFLINLLKNGDLNAVGETGLDYHYLISSKEEQKVAFEKQIEIAEAMRLPLIIHSRNAFQDTLIMLKGVTVPVVIHCFTYSTYEADIFLKNGFYLSFSGIATFKNAEKIREAARIVPDDKILVETDSPYLAPLPYRGKRNEPLFVKETALFLAKYLNKDEKLFLFQTLNNGLKFFNLKK